MKNKKQKKQKFEEMDLTGYSEPGERDLALIVSYDNYSIFQGNKTNNFYVLTANGEFKALIGSGLDD